MQPLTSGDVAFLDGLLDPLDDLPDGAWQAACESAIACCDRFKGRNPYDVWIAWIEAKGKE